MPQGTVKAVYPIEGRRKPGAVLFQDGQKFTTFDAAVMRAAEGTEGQLVEYTTKQDGKYVNLASIRVLGGVPPQRASTDGGGSGIFNAGALVSAVVSLGATINALRDTVEKLSNVRAESLSSLRQPASDAPPTTEDPVSLRQNLLAGKVGAAQAEASINALKKKYAKSPEKLLDAVNTLLVVNDIEAPA